MNIIDYDVTVIENKTLIFLKVEQIVNEGKLSYKTLNNIIYKLSDGYCVTDKKGSPITVRDTMDECEEFLNEEYANNFNKINKNLKLKFGETQTT